MWDVLGYLVIGVLIISFFYFGYRDDYKRNPSEFIKTIIGVPLTFMGFIFEWTGISALVDKWTKKGEE